MGDAKMFTDIIDLENKLKIMLLPVLGLESVDEISSDNSLVLDLGAESLDFVEIIYLVEKNFGVRLETNEILMGSSQHKMDDLFKDGKLTQEGSIILKEEFPNSSERFNKGMTKMDMFSAITVGDLANIIKIKSEVS
jgi:acyl carrier protein